MKINEEFIRDNAYLVSRRVRLIATVGSCVKEDIEEMTWHLKNQSMNVGGKSIIPFVVQACFPEGNKYICGFAATEWALDLYKWIQMCDNIPAKQRHRIAGMLHGYDSDSIRDFEERISGDWSE